MAEFLQFLFSGITVGSTYALAALGFTLFYNSSNVINFAQGEFIMLGGMLAVYFSQTGLPMPIAFMLAFKRPWAAFWGWAFPPSCKPWKPVGRRRP